MFPGDSAIEKLLAHREAPIPSLSNSRAGITPDLEIAFTKMVAKKVEDRYASMTEVISTLSRLQTEIAENLISTEDLATTNFERGSYPETIDVEAVITIKGREGNKETDKHFGGKTLAYIRSILQKAYKPRVIAVTSIMGLVFLMLLLMVFMKLGAKVKEDGKEKIAKQMEKEKLKQEEEAKFAAIEKEMVLIPAGKFKMGSPASEKGRRNDETQHDVILTKPFYMGKYEITQEQWEGVMGNNPSSNKGAKLPVTNLSWNDCQEFIKKLKAKTRSGYRYRLPTEAEWEYACRAGKTTAYSVGASLTNIDANISGSSTKAVGSYKPNAFGLYDMHGNVWEWCEDWYENYPAGTATDPKGPGTEGSRVLRGGSFVGNVSTARSSGRFYFTPTAQNDLNFGFRLARTP